MHLLLKLYFKHVRRSFSQVGQDRWCIDKVHNGKRGGYFVEFGAHDGLNLSNTALLEMSYHWTGVCLEPNPDSYARLKRNRSCLTFECAVGEQSGRAGITLRGETSEIVDRSGLSGDMADIEVRPLADVLTEANAPRTIDFMSVDVEGFEDQALLSFPFDQWTVLSLCVERPSPRLKRKLEEAGLLMVQEIPGLDAFYIHHSLAAQYKDLQFTAHWSGVSYFVYRILRHFVG